MRAPDVEASVLRFAHRISGDAESTDAEIQGGDNGEIAVGQNSTICAMASHGRRGRPLSCLNRPTAGFPHAQVP